MKRHSIGVLVVLFALLGCLSVASVSGAESASEPKSVPLESTSPGVLGKTVTFTEVDADKVRVTITGLKGQSTSAVVYTGDVRLATMVVIPPPNR